MEDDIPDMSRPQMYLFGCTLKSDKKEFKFDVEDDDTEHQLSIKSVCLGAEAEDKFHMVEIEGFTYEGKTTKVPLVVLKPSVLPSMSLGGFEISPPVTFRLESGSGPIHISGQHFVSMKESDDEEDEDDDDEEENNSSPMKRQLISGKKPPMKKSKMDSDLEDEEDSDEDDESDEDNAKTQKVSKQPKKPSPAAKKPKPGVKQNGSSGKQTGPAVKASKSPNPKKDDATPPKPMNVADVKKKLASVIKEGKPLPKTEQKFENYALHTFKISDKSVIKELWSFLQTQKVEKK